MSVYLDYLVDKFMDEERQLMDDLDEASVSEADPRDGGTMDANKYKASVLAITDLLKDMSALERLEAIAFVSITTMVPIIALDAWVLETYGPDEFINNHMHNCMKFYNITKVLIKDKVLT